MSFGRAASVRALFWSGLSAGASSALTLVRSVLLARLLRPDDFGLFGLANFALAGAATLTELNLGRAAIVTRFASPAEERRFLDTAFTADLIRRGALALLLCGASPWIARGLGDGRVFPLLLVACAPLVLQGFGNPGTVLLARDLALRPLALVRQASDAAGLVCTVVAALLGAAVWALVLGQIAAALASTLLSYTIHPHRPRLAFDRRLFRLGFDYGRHLTTVLVLTFVTTQVDNLFVGRALGTALLGVYLFAYRLAMLPVDGLSQVLANVVLSTYARLRHEEPGRLEQQLFRNVGLTVAALAAMLLPLHLFAREAVLLLGGARWEGAIPVLAPLLLAAFFRGTVHSLSPLLHALGKPQLDARGKIFEAALFVPACYLLVERQGLFGAALAGVICYALSLVLRFGAVTSVLPGSRARLLRAIARPALCALAALLLAALLSRLGLPRLLAGALAELGFLLGAWALDENLRDELRRVRQQLEGKLAPVP